jgi:hypothetical protein
VNVSNQENENWEESYRLAALEVDVRKMPERILTAKHAIARRLEEIESNNERREERKRLDHALDTLKALTSETKAWKV